MFYAFHRNLRESRHAHSVGGFYAEFYYFVIYSFTQVFFHASAELVLDVARRARTEISHKNTDSRADQRINEFHGFGILGQQIHGVANASGNRNVCNQPDCLQQYGDKDVLLISADESE